ncbi:hypothetical protein BJ085DRAFT_29206 [Dimargaris cristalligena]|uniref:Uncharacterized protein n=1 Tax=Dimargaris cristalligena TaxID=215637 RepID=A0A4P9ZNV4_9FUNG|nr:hypothetical protein BJ085DRAFT_29206 [Dimargaris cristalligena]|eukprot:RKP34848.1 hypothetical protein BJ085DRAFT_29206 [Dimargaris cristalligena]
MPRRLTRSNLIDHQPDKLHRTFVDGLSKYARNKDILSLFSVGRAQEQVLRPFCFRRVRIATSSSDAHEMHSVLRKYRENIHQVTLVLDSEFTADPRFCDTLGRVINILAKLKSLVIEVYHPALLQMLVRLLGPAIQQVEKFKLVNPMRTNFYMNPWPVLIPERLPYGIENDNSTLVLG